MKMNTLRVVYMGQTAYQAALDIQTALHARVMNGETDDTLLLLEHPPVITMGQSAVHENVYLSEEQRRILGVDVFQTDRGGDVTYHGPGQIVGYPIFNLTRHGKDVHAFMCNVQEVFLRLLSRDFGFAPHREDGKYTGIWIGNQKITAFGIHVRRWTTTHGFAFNVNTDLSHFRWINPCGLSDRGVTSLKELTGETQDIPHLNRRIAQLFCEVFCMEESECTLQSLLGS
ncbi:MAG TPA: lipoyl(octanoyl) transferase LipB [Candidatus Limiplasma sp.]|nr:lipoyl(octanoyl) transferase LipB [Candidatus Limiplasma sp.]HRX09379.1 lipoyl(octanoyl) transferase LipB [Candidatus Limiplasma sp.]